MFLLNNSTRVTTSNSILTHKKNSIHNTPPTPPTITERFFDRQSVNPARNKNPYSFSEKFSASRAEITSPAQVRSERGQLYGEAKKTVKQYHVI